MHSVSLYYLYSLQIFPSSDHYSALSQTLQAHDGRENGLNIPALISMIFN